MRDALISTGQQAYLDIIPKQAVMSNPRIFPLFISKHQTNVAGSFLAAGWRGHGEPVIHRQKK